METYIVLTGKQLDEDKSLEVVGELRICLNRRRLSA